MIYKDVKFVDSSKLLQVSLTEFKIQLIPLFVWFVFFVWVFFGWLVFLLVE